MCPDIAIILFVKCVQSIAIKKRKPVFVVKKCVLFISSKCCRCKRFKLHRCIQNCLYSAGTKRSAVHLILLSLNLTLHFFNFGKTVHTYTEKLVKESASSKRLWGGVKWTTKIWIECVKHAQLVRTHSQFIASAPICMYLEWKFKHFVKGNSQILCLSTPVRQLLIPGILHFYFEAHFLLSLN